MIRKSLFVAVAFLVALYPLSLVGGSDSGKMVADGTPAIRAAAPAQVVHGPAAPRGPGFVINELNSDTTGVDQMEFIEIYDGGIGNLPLFGYVVVFFNGSAPGDGSYFAVDLDGKSTNPRGYFVLGNALVTNALIGGGMFGPQHVLQFADNVLQNGQDAVGLYQIPNPPPANSGPTMLNLVDAVVYDTNDADDPALMAALLNPGQPQVDEGVLPPDLSIQRCPNGSGGQKNTSSYAQGVPTPGDDNNPSCPVTLSSQAPGSTQAPPAIPGNSESNRGSLGSNYTRNVNLFSGEVVENAVDLRVKSRGLDVIWARRYGSRNPRTTAMGNGWDYSYNISIHNDLGPTMITLHDGDGREDIYLQTGPSTWVNDQFARELRLNGDLTYTLAFSDGGHWHFFPIDGSPVSGKCDRISDRNNNSILLFYDGGGRLTQLIDTVGRPYFVGYDPDGFIQSLSDFTGRTVTYQHYQNPDPGGSSGDLASVTTPPVIGTPTCNDFPLGKMTSYSYSEGLAPAELNSNLLTITDPKGQVFLTNTYAATAVPTDIDFDHVARQEWGLVGNIDIVYVAQTPSPANNNAVVKAIVNDRMGHVKHVYFNAQNLGVIDREYTGVAPLPDSPTTDAVNLPGPPLRVGDPDWFETRYEYDAYGRAVRIVDANLNEELFAYMLPGDDPSPLARGNLAVHSWLPGPLGGAQPVIQESFSYVPGTSYMTQHVDGRGNPTFHLVDPFGNVLQTIHRGGLALDDWTYDPFGQMTSHTLPDNGSGQRRVDMMTYTSEGYVQTNTMDADGSPATTTYSYDARGNVISQTDPCGNTSLTEYNALDQAMRMQSNEITLGGGNRIETLTYYDANNNVVRVDVQNRDEFENVVPTNTHWSTISEYGLLNERIGQCQEVSAAALPCTSTLDCAAASGFGTFIKTESEYNPNGGVTLTRSGVATDGSQPTNVMRTLVDERDLTYQVISAEGDPNSSTAQYDYNGNRGVVRMTIGVGDPGARVITNTYDGYDRLISTLDPMGNVTTYAYDANHNPVTVEMYGELLDVPGSAGNILLSSTTTTFDPMDLATARVMQHFNPNTGLPIGDGAMTTQTQYAPTGQVMAVIDDAGQITSTVYTTANRPLRVTDPRGNRVEYQYDLCGNTTSVTDIDLSDIGGPDEAYISTHTYNGLNQGTSTSDAAGLTTQRHDSRGNLVLSTNAMGIETRYEYDGLSRKIRSIQDMDASGADGSPADIVTVQVYDGASRLISEADGKGNTTVYAYDALNRKIATNHADSTANSATYDVFGNVTQSTDANGSVVTYTYDLLNRGTNKNIAPGPGVAADTTFETYAYDGMSRIVRAQNDVSLVTQQFDSLSRVISETTNGLTTTSEWDASGNKTFVQYPGGRQVQYAYDALNRLVTVNDNFVGPLAQYYYRGSYRVERRQLFPPNVTTDFTFNPARMIQRTRSTRGLTVIDDRIYQWSPTGNKTQRKDIRPGGPGLTHDYVYDAADRLVRTIVSDPVATVLRDTTYTLDQAGNRSNVAGPGTPDSGTYSQDPNTPIPADFQANQYTTSPYDSREYDNNGNLRSFGCLSGDVNNDGSVNLGDVPPFSNALVAGTPTLCSADANGNGSANGGDVQRETDYILGLAIPTRPFSALYDYRNRMVRHSNLVTGEVATYAYDALGRRIQKVVNGIETNYIHDGWQVIEERDGGGVTTQTNVWGNYVDELLTRRRFGVDYYYHTDDMHSVMAVTDAAGTVIGRYEYGDYGRPLDPNTLIPLSFFDPGSEPFTGLHGRAYDNETGWYYFRTRYMDPRTGRFTTRVAIGIWGDAEGNSYSFCGNNPWSRFDPIGRGFWFYRWWWWRWYCYGWWKWWCPWRYCGYYCYYWWWWYPYRWWLWWWWPYQWYGYYYWWWSPYWTYCWYPYRWCWWPYRWWWWWYPYRWYGYHCGWWWWWYSWRCWVWYPYGGTWWWWWYPHCWGYYYWWNWWWWNPWRWYWSGWWWYTYGWWGYYYNFYWCYPYRWYWWWWHWWWWPCGWWWQPYGWWGCYYDWWWCWYPYYWWSWWWGWWYPYGWWGWYYGWFWWWYPWGCWYWWWWYPYGWYSWWWGWFWWWWWWPYGWWWWWPFRWWWWWCL
ncbi:MAG TPA: hypothetical protein VJZ71_00600 [Phycisphaerae bacterium]|nr:hypothetical protein [Phycisphaerae bacterium]